MSKWSKFCGWLLKKMGWTSDNGPIPEPKAIVLGVPHTSAWDFIISYLFYTQFDRVAHVMIKKEFFFWPVGPLLRKCGCIPVDRSNSATLVKSLIEEMEKVDYFILAIAPEGTRKAIRKWKTGYHLIAKEVGCPVYAGYFDWGTKHVGIGEKFPLTDDARADTDRLQAHYEKMKMQGKNKDGYITH
ncbi:MAG: 1-acyl-sn-glycerol-3-phosphate acyltransferase [Bacteroidales bacterium]|jgi:1-acyl-sn-glycerol-3-phosphate acyltransferase|nr:1-acyl-sn-glycerol-3-phosphate acyltransferase [Bacteroidales bacterium]MDY2934617.1 1-acyl-sn-glycerol-3-phosphate acyltransferase [Candidatus Cryptobacteroides sp.]MCH3941682.1 1-acyl-sn-glycerol-3-phosphate acyltransferase [Bacteroidales bacterium]MCI2134916.1 1-acyl-sn-glycerol-3-phosphate acyltransferase [Bacteroidales bacterium]MCI5719177.1 1-acyl-sn-glycerol-3-phosphate acyltransferase [Bacteroidales bacterium]